MPSKTVNEIKQEYYNHFRYLLPLSSNDNVVREIWNEYNKSNISSPDIDAIMSNFPDKP